MSFLNKKHVPTFSNTSSGKSLNHPSKSQTSYNETHNNETLHQKASHPNPLGGYSNLQSSPKKLLHPQVSLRQPPEKMSLSSSHSSFLSTLQ